MHCVHFSGIDHFFVSSLPVLPFSPVHKSVSETSHLVESSPANSAFNCWEKGMGGGAFVSLGKGQVALAIWVSFIPDICLWFRSHFPQFLPEHLSLSSVPHHPHSCSFSACPLSLFLPHPLYFQNQSCVCLVKILSAFLLAIYKVLFTLLHKNSDFYPSRYPRVFPSPLCPLFIVITQRSILCNYKKSRYHNLCDSGKCTGRYTDVGAQKTVKSGQWSHLINSQPITLTFFVFSPLAKFDPEDISSPFVEWVMPWVLQSPLPPVS